MLILRHTPLISERSGPLSLAKRLISVKDRVLPRSTALQGFSVSKRVLLRSNSRRAPRLSHTLDSESQNSGRWSLVLWFRAFYEAAESLYQSYDTPPQWHYEAIFDYGHGAHSSQVCELNMGPHRVCHLDSARPIHCSGRQGKASFQMFIDHSLSEILCCL